MTYDGTGGPSYFGPVARSAAGSTHLTLPANRPGGGGDVVLVVNGTGAGNATGSRALTRLLDPGNALSRRIDVRWQQIRKRCPNRALHIMACKVDYQPALLPALLATHLKRHCSRCRPTTEHFNCGVMHLIKSLRQTSIEEWVVASVGGNGMGTALPRHPQ
jgi:hypothetical protein